MKLKIPEWLKQEAVRRIMKIDILVVFIVLMVSSILGVQLGIWHGRKLQAEELNEKDMATIVYLRMTVESLARENNAFIEAFGCKELRAQLGLNDVEPYETR